MIYVSLTTQLLNEELFCNLKFTNNTKSIFFLDKKEIGMTEKVRSKLFLIHKNNDVIPYSGMMKKRKTPGVNDYLAIQPGDSVNTKIRIDNIYEFEEGNHEYTIQYSRYHGSPKDEAVLNKVESDVIRFFYNKKTVNSK